MARNRFIAACLLYPLSRLYGLGVWVRNKLFDHRVFKQREFDIPIVVIGNIAIGGTGKTPHVEYLIRRYMNRYNVAVLSRGYKRDTSGFVMAGPSSTPSEIGDEPYQIYRKFGNRITVAVCERRADGIDRLRELNPDISLILLDDAFQHRHVKPSASVVLTEFHRPVYADHLLPYGRLREPLSGLNRADIIVVTKCPPDMEPLEYRLWKERLNLFPFQKLYFSTYLYGALLPVFPSSSDETPQLRNLPPHTNILALSGIANPRPFLSYLRRSGAKVKLCRFSDHHSFSASDLKLIADRFDQLPPGNNFIVTTEKDAVRLVHNPQLPSRLKPLLYYLPIQVDFVERGDGEFSQCVEKTFCNAHLFK